MKIGRNLKTPESRNYWTFLDKTSAKVESWPKWKKDRIKQWQSD